MILGWAAELRCPCTPGEGCGDAGGRQRGGSHPRRGQEGEAGAALSSPRGAGGQAGSPCEGRGCGASRRGRDRSLGGGGGWLCTGGGWRCHAAGEWQRPARALASLASDCHDNTAVTNPLPDGITPPSAGSARGLLWRPAPGGYHHRSGMRRHPGRTGGGAVPEQPQPPQRCAGGVCPRLRCKVPAAPVHPGAGRAGRAGCPSAGPPLSPGGWGDAMMPPKHGRSPRRAHGARAGLQESARGTRACSRAASVPSPNRVKPREIVAAASCRPRNRGARDRAHRHPGVPQLGQGGRKGKVGGRPPLLFPRVRPIALATPGFGAV